MNKPIQIILFAVALVAVVALAVILGWNLGPRTNRHELLNLQAENQRLKQKVASNGCSITRDLFMTLLSVQQHNPSATGIEVLNECIDNQIRRQYSMNILPDGTIGLGPTTEEWYLLAAAVGDYRDIHPVEYPRLEMKSSMEKLIQLASKQRDELKNMESSNQ